MTTSKRDGDRHHYVPQFYMRKFARNGQLKVHPLSGSAPSIQSVRNTAMRYDFYLVPEYTPDPGVLESSFSPIERRADYLFRRITSGEWPLPLDDRVFMAEFIAFQALRGPEVRDQIAAIVANAGRRERQNVEITSVQEWIAERGGPDVAADAAASAWAQAANEVFGTPVDATFHAEQIDRLIDRTLPSLVTRAWSLIRFDEPSLIGCDVPVCAVSSTGALTQAARLVSADRIAYPLGRSTALVLGGSRHGGGSQSEVQAVMDGQSDAILNGSADRREVLNRWTAGNARTVIFHHPDDVNLVPDSVTADPSSR